MATESSTTDRLKTRVFDVVQPWKWKLIFLLAAIGAILRIGPGATGAYILGEFVGVSIALTIYTVIVTLAFRLLVSLLTRLTTAASSS